jgi:hypothetical protein
MAKIQVPSSVEVNNEWSFTSTPDIRFHSVCCLDIATTLLLFIQLCSTILYICNTKVVYIRCVYLIYWATSRRLSVRTAYKKRKQDRIF